MVGTPNAGSVQRGRMKHAPRTLVIAISAWAAGCTASPAADGDGGATTGRTSGDGDTASDADPTGGTAPADATTEDPPASGCDDPEAAVEAIFAAECTMMGCHGSSAAAGLDLSGADWIDQLVGRAASQCDGRVRVIPGDLEGSLLYEKVAGPTDCGQEMPVGNPLPASDVDCIATWIQGLAASTCEMCGGDACIDLESSAQHCGACDSPCPPGVACVAGECACPAGTEACDGACVDTMADGTHCGGCGRACEAGLVCNAGTCSDDCGALTECAGGCVDTQTHPLHCGGCDAPCTGGSACTAGSCACPGEPVGYVEAIEPIFVAACTAMGCHGFPAPQEGLDLRAGEGFAALVGVPSTQCADGDLVIPGDPAGSYLVHKLQGVDLCFGTQMPKMGSLPAADIDLVAQWICHGALP
jgi:hypothetical protein